MPDPIHLYVDACVDTLPYQQHPYWQRNTQQRELASTCQHKLHVPILDRL